jgi:hypothetical protein
VSGPNGGWAEAVGAVLIRPEAAARKRTAIRRAFITNVGGF